MNKEEKQAIKEAKKLIEEEAHNLNDINIFMTDSTTLKILLKYIDKLQKENEELQADKNKLINYIAVRENKTHEEVCKEFELGE